MYVFLIFLCLPSLCSEVGADITSTWFLRDPDQVTSSNGYFKLGFFSPQANSTNRYVGIWYNTGSESDALEVVWVANRDNPLEDSSGVLGLSEDGNRLQVLDGQNKIVWSSNSTHDKVNNNSSVARLLGTGNLVLLSDIVSGKVIWQSFERPTNTWLPQMRLSNHGNTDERSSAIRSWKNPSDPSSGRFTKGITTSSHGLSEIFIWDDGQPYWRTGPWNRNFFVGLPPMYYWGLTNGFRLVNDNENLPSLMFSTQDPANLEHYVLSYDGLVLHKQWNKTNHKWDILWRSIDSACDLYGKCGPFGKCNPRDSPICSCLEGFEPINDEEWRNGNWTSGCSRRTPLQCGTMTGSTDGFLRLQNMKVPDQAELLAAIDEEDCRIKCQAQCSCLAYAYYLGTGCMTWSHTLIDIQEFNANVVDLFLRLAHSELAGKNRKWKTIVLSLITGTITLAGVAFFLWRWTCRQERKGKPIRSSMSELNVSEVQFKDLQLFKFEKLTVATNNFHASNKLGEGGFGPVFKGNLDDGQQIAVKRLSRASGQGLQEFMNEVLLISKLQHRNLVRLLGCCVEGEEKLLVYEYMPNKSLDALLFDPLQRELLDWKIRLNIIEGICRGLLYLHRDSRLRIIHRDLKASNILLDEELNPKISDFGMAKIIFGHKEDQGKTSRLVGTYGYMPPEYAMEGWFSEKSDVYSFGVLLLELVSGRRNNSFTDDDESSSLLGYVWKLWNDDKVLMLIDPTIGNPCFQAEISKCIQLGLLCVQEYPEDRPTISTVVSMLDSEISDLPHPMQPGFTQTRNYSRYQVTPNEVPNCSVNNVSITLVSGR